MQIEAGQERLQTYTEGMLDGVCVTDPDGILTQVNKTLVELYGFRSEEDLVGRPLFSMVSREDAPRLEECLGETVKGKQPIIKNLEVTIVRKDGKTTPAALNITNLWSGKGEYTGSVSVIKDITGRKKTEEALQTSAQQWRSTFDAISDAVCLLDSEGRILKCNKAMANFVRKPFSEIIDRFCYEVVHGTSEPIEGCPIVRMRETCRRETMSLAVCGQWFDVVVDPLLDEDGKLIGAVHILTDITGRKGAEEALQESEERYRNLIQSTHEIIQSVRPDGNFVFVNQAWFDLLGYSEEELSSLTVFDIIHSDCLPYCKKMFSRVMGGESIREIEATFVSKNGKSILVEGNAVPRYLGGRVVASQGFFRDVTRQKEVEEALKNAKRDLEIRVKERTKELEKAQLRLVETEKLATLGKMASVVAHELRNPMGVIKLATYSLKKKIDPKDKNLMKHLENVDKKITESDQIIGDLLAFSRASELEFAPADLNECVEEALKTTEQQIKAHDVRIIRNLNRQVPKIVADSTELVEIFYNMFLNAAQAMKESKKRELTVSTRRKGKTVEVEVSDTGCGISKKNLKRLGEPFFSTKIKGIGLGLYIVHEIVRKHKGNVRAESEVNKGTIFVIELPVKPET